MWFAVSVVTAFAAALAPGAVVAPAGSDLLNIGMPLLGFLGGGALAGGSLKLGWRGVVGFAIAFTLALPILLLSSIAIQGMGGDERLSTLVLYFGTTGGVAFALIGVVGGAIAGIGWREAIRSAAVFGCAGFSGGLLLALSLSASVAGQRDSNLLLLMLGEIAFVVLPAAIGGSMLQRRLRSHNGLRDQTA